MTGKMGEGKKNAGSRGTWVWSEVAGRTSEYSEGRAAWDLVKMTTMVIVMLA